MCAISLDGKLAPAAESSSREFGKYIPGELTGRLMDLREEVDGIVAGSNTVVLDDSELLRPSREPIRRVVVDSSGTLSPELTILSDDHQATVAVSRSTPSEYVEQVESLPNKSTLRVGEDNVDLNALVESLVDSGVESLLLEGGGTLIDRFLRNQLIDEFRLLRMPYFVGDADAVSLCEGESSLFPDVELDVNEVTEHEGFVLTSGTVAYRLEHSSE